MSSKELEDLKAEDIIALSVDDVVRAVSQLGQDSPCLICKNPDHSLATDGGKACLANSTLVSHTDQSLWFYVLICKSCANTRFLEATVVAHRALEGKNNAER